MYRRGNKALFWSCMEIATHRNNDTSSGMMDAEAVGVIVRVRVVVTELSGSVVGGVQWPNDR